MEMRNTEPRDTEMRNTEPRNTEAGVDYRAAIAQAAQLMTDRTAQRAFKIMEHLIMSAQEQKEEQPMMNRKQTMMNRKQAEAVFAQEAVCIKGVDVIPVDRCEAITGVKLEKWSFDPRKHWSLFGIGWYQFAYFTLAGFLEAITVMNVREYAKAQGAKPPQERKPRKPIRTLSHTCRRAARG